MKALGCYIFAGGFTLGVKRAGFTPVAHLEDGLYGVESSKANHPGLNFHTNPDTWPLDAYQDVPFVYGNPPCAPWSSGGMSPNRSNTIANENWRNDPRIQCVRNLFHVLEVIHPKVWVWESVARVWKAGRPFVNDIVDQAHHLGYSATAMLYDNLDCGVPQYRKRFMLFLHRIALTPFPPQGDGPKTVREAIGGLIDPGPPGPKLPERYAELWPYGKPGEDLRRTFDRLHPDAKKDPVTGRITGRPGFSWKRLHWDRPSYTATGGAVICHPDEPRIITIKEFQLLCAYPEDYMFVGSLGKQYAQVAQAVLPPTGQWVATIARKALEQNDPRHGHDFRLFNYLNGVVISKESTS